MKYSTLLLDLMISSLWAMVTLTIIAGGLFMIVLIIKATLREIASIELPTARQASIPGAITLAILFCASIFLT